MSMNKTPASSDSFFTEEELKAAAEMSQPMLYGAIPPSNEVDRFEVIDDTGRAYVKGSIYGTPVKIELDYQDEGRTLKVFVREVKG